MFMLTKLAWIFVSFFVIAGGRAVVEWMSLNVLGISDETSDTIAAAYVALAALALIAVAVQRLRR